jgi:hypothetical protein
MVNKKVRQTRTTVARDVPPIPFNPEFVEAVLDVEVGVDDVDLTLARSLQATGAFLGRSEFRRLGDGKRSVCSRRKKICIMIAGQGVAISRDELR